MLTLTRLLAGIVFLLSAAAAAVDALVFDVPSGTSKCLKEFLRGGVHSHMSYRVAEATSAAGSTVSVRVTGPGGEELHLTESVERGRFVFQATGDGEYVACFWTPHYERGAIVSVHAQWAVGLRVHAEGPLAAVSTAKGSIDSMVGELKSLEDSVRFIHEEMIYLSEREGEMQRLNEDTTARMHSFTLLSLALCAGVAALQLWHLKIFFQKRNVL